MKKESDMFSKITRVVYILMALTLILAACAPGQPTQSPEQIQSQIETSVAMTIAAADAATAQAVAAFTETPTSTPVATSTPFVLPTSPLLASPTPFVIVPSGGGGGGGGGGGNTTTSYSCTVVSEKPYDGAEFKPGDSFDKYWTIKNTGTVTWDASWDFEYIGGTDMSPTADMTIGQNVKPGETITLMIEVIAPDVTKKEGSKIFVMTWSLNHGTHFCTPYVAIRVIYPPGQN
jgi:hypothetical protein